MTGVVTFLQSEGCEFDPRGGLVLDPFFLPFLHNSIQYYVALIYLESSQLLVHAQLKQTASGYHAALKHGTNANFDLGIIHRAEQHPQPSTLSLSLLSAMLRSTQIPG